MKKALLFTGFVLLSIQLFAQRDMKPGYVITNSDDTIYGQIDYQGDVYNSGNCYFKSDKENSPINYQPGEIKAYRFVDGKYYISRDVTIKDKSKKVFLEFLIDGKVDIFFLSPYYFIEKENMDIHILESTEKIVVRNNDEYYKEGKEYVGILAAYMKDYPAISTKIQRSELDQDDLIKIASEYHNNVCPNEECTVFSKVPPKTIFKIGYAVGCNINELDLYNYQADKSWSDWAPGIMTGLQLDFSNKGTHERFSAILSFSYSQQKHNEPALGYYPVNYLTKNILVSAAFNYTYPKYKMKPFVGLGILYFQTLKSSKNLSSAIAYEPEKKSAGPLFSLGLKADLSQKISLKFEADYHYGYFNDSDDNYYFSTTNNINFLLIFQYTLSGGQSDTTER